MANALYLLQSKSTWRIIMNTYKVTLENYDGKCKAVKVLANDPYTAMAVCQKGGWYPVDVKQV